MKGSEDMVPTSMYMASLKPLSSTSPASCTYCLEMMEEEKGPKGYKCLAVGKVRDDPAMPVLGTADMTGNPVQLFGKPTVRSGL